MPELPAVSSQARLDIIHQFECSSHKSQAAELCSTSSGQPGIPGKTPETAHDETLRVRVSKASFTYSCETDSKLSDSTPTVSNIAMEAGEGELICIVGAVGSGKSTVLSGIFGELRCTIGFVQKRGRVLIVLKSLGSLTVHFVEM